MKSFLFFFFSFHYFTITFYWRK